MFRSSGDSPFIRLVAVSMLGAVMNWLVTVRIVALIAGTAVLGTALITGEVRIRGGRWATTKSMPNNPIRRRDTPRDFWFAWGISAFLFALVMCFVFAL